MFNYAKLVQSGYSKFNFYDDGLSSLVKAIAHIPTEFRAKLLHQHPSINSAVASINGLLTYYFNEDAPSVTEYAFSPPKGNKVSVGTFYLAFNHTETTIDLGVYQGTSILLQSGEGCYLNLGLCGVSFAFKDTNILQIIIHSALDTLGYFSDSKEILLQTKPQERDRLSSNIFQNELNLTTFLSQGYATNQLSRQYADELLQWIKSEHFIPVHQNHIDQSCGYSNRFISKHSMFKPQKIKTKYSHLVHSVNDLCAPLLHGRPNPNGDNLSIFVGTQNYFMDLHSDCSDGSPVITIIYLSDEKINEQDGGHISSARMKLDPQKNTLVWDHTEIKKLPKHGFALHINNSTPKFHHQAHKVLSKKYRWSVIINSSMLTNPTWNINFDEKTGTFEHRSFELGNPSQNK